MGKWEMVRLGEMTKIRTGKLDANASDANGKYPFFTCAINPLRIDSYSYDCECVLVAGNGDLNVKYYQGKFDAYQRTYIIESLSCDKLYLPYLFRFLQKYITVLRSQTSGGVIQYIRLNSLTDAKLPLPPIHEQKRIAKNLDLASEIVKGYKEQLAQLDKLVQSVFYEMFNGIKQTVKLSHYIKALTAGKSLAGTEPCINKVLKTGAVSYDYFDKVAVKYLPLEYKPTKDNLVKMGNVIISRMNTIELVGAAAYVWDVDANTYLPDRLWRAELLSNNANPIFIWQILIQESAKRQIRKVASGTSGSMKNISKPNLLSMTVIDAPLCLQTRFASIVTAIEAQKAQVQQALTEAETLFHSLMQEYFE